MAVTRQSSMYNKDAIIVRSEYTHLSANMHGAPRSLDVRLNYTSLMPEGIHSLHQIHHLVHAATATSPDLRQDIGVT